MIFPKAVTLIVATTALVSEVAAFTTPLAYRTSSSALFASRVDRTEAIKVAVEAGKIYGASSQEARLAWEVVEEIAESDISAAYKGGVNVEECEVTEVVDPACVEYEQKLEEMRQLIADAKTEDSPTKDFADEVRPLKVTETPAVTSQQDTPELQAALAHAQSMTAQYGLTSPEAKLAWEALEEQASNNEKNDALGGKLSSEECLTEAIEACEAIEELNRAINLYKNKN